MRAERVLIILAGITLIFGGLLIGLELATIEADVPKGQPTVIQLVDAEGKKVKESSPISLTLISQSKTCKKNILKKNCQTVSATLIKEVYTDKNGRYSVSNKSFLPSSSEDYNKIISRAYKKTFGEEITKSELDFLNWTRTTLSKKDYFTSDDILDTITANSKSNNYQLKRSAKDYGLLVVAIQQAAGLGSLSKAGYFTFKAIKNLPQPIEATGGLVEYQSNKSNFDLKFDKTNYKQSLNLTAADKISSQNSVCPK